MSDPKVELSILDKTVIWKGTSASQVLKESLELASSAEQLGYKRYWISENHNTADHASSASEMLVAHIASSTTRINVGTGNLMLPHQSALKVVENFRTLEGVFPGRVDLGFALSIGDDLTAAQALHRTHEVIGKDEYLEHMIDFLAFLTNSYSTSRGKIIAIPNTATIPGVWIQGSNYECAQYAIEYGLGLVLDHNTSPHTSAEVLRAYRKFFKPSVFQTKPHSILIVPVLCTDTDEASRFGSELRQLAGEAAVDELMIVTMHSDIHVRIRSIELLAKEFQLMKPLEGVINDV